MWPQLQPVVETGTRPGRLLFVGSLDVAPSYGGPIQFHRHFVERNDYTFAKLIEPARTRLSYLRFQNKLLDDATDRATRTRLFPHFVALNEWLAGRRAFSQLLPAARAFAPDAIVTVAFGAYSTAAARIAKHLDVPLITFFHDWWHDLSIESRAGLWIFDRQMRALGRRSDLALCVCEEMKAELGAPPSAKILYPIGPAPTPMPARVRRARPRIVYLGGMTKGYGRMVAALARAYAEAPGTRPWELAIFGRTADWRREDVEFASQSGAYRGERFGDAARAELADADVFLSVMDFERAARRRVRTSFPSKLLEHCSYGRPVMAWAPEYSSLAGFARRTNFPYVHTQVDARSFVEAIDRIVCDSAYLDQNAAMAAQLAATDFAPDSIHAQLVTEIDRVLARRGRKMQPSSSQTETRPKLRECRSAR